VKLFKTIKNYLEVIIRLVDWISTIIRCLHPIFCHYLLGYRLSYVASVSLSMPGPHLYLDL